FLTTRTRGKLWRDSLTSKLARKRQRLQQLTVHLMVKLRLLKTVRNCNHGLRNIDPKLLMTLRLKITLSRCSSEPSNPLISLICFSMAPRGQA
ncbi:hypothetical protein DH86_00000067, partial [Scytalidium sp. 3C]